MTAAPPTTQQLQLPTLDDLIFLLSIVSNPNGFIAEQQQQKQQSSIQRGGHQKSSRDKGGSSWQHTLASLPSQRRDIILALQRLANARQKLNNASTKDYFRDNQMQSRLQHDEEADVLKEVENAASAIRICSTNYLQVVDGYKTSLQRFWHLRPFTHRDENNKPNDSELERVGRQLASQLICQLQWDERLARSTLSFLDEELYNHNDGGDANSQSSSNATTEKLRIWADAMSKMIKIDTSYWDFVEREVYDETELEQEKENRQLLNGEPSTQMLEIGPFIEIEEKNQENIMQSASDNSIAPSVKEDGSLHERIVSSTSVEDAVETFMHSESLNEKKEISSGSSQLQERNSSITSILLVGEEGCGKTHLLDSIQRQYASGTKSSSSKSSSIKILRPNYPVDLVGNSIGSTEDRLIALFTYASQVVSEGGRSKKCLILLDDIDQIFSLSDDIGDESSLSNEGARSTQYYVGRRCKALFVTILDTLRERLPSGDCGGHLLLLCTSRSRCREVVGRFDRIYRKGQPDEKQRKQTIVSCLSRGTGIEEEDADIKAMLSLIVRHSAGRSAFELSQCCRETILTCAESDSSEQGGSNISKLRLQCLDKILQTKSPQSLRGGSLDGIVDMRVYTPEELQSKLTVDGNGEVHMPLLGAEAKRALESLMNVVITPLCRSDEIRALLYGGPGNNDRRAIGSKPIKVGALLAGAPGVGKSSLAYHCASLAAKMSRVSLLDVSCTSLIHKEIGGSERAVQQLFTAVRAAAPCILLLDGIECVAPKRGNDNTSEGTMDRVLSTFLTEMDGIETGGGGTSGNVAVIGITHNPDLIDPSLLRPGRLEKTITLGAPDFEARKELVARQIEDVEFDFASAGYFDAKSKDDIFNFVAMASTGMSAVEVIAICREASMECLRELDFEAITERPLLRHEHFKSAISMMKGKAGNM